MTRFSPTLLKEIADERGSLVALEGGRDVPFEIKRVYYVYGTTPGVSRGFHAHKTLRQFLVCVNGSCSVEMDDGEYREQVALDRPSNGLYIAPMVWHAMHGFSSDCVLVVLADGHYDETDYVRDYDEFRTLTNRS